MTELPKETEQQIAEFQQWQQQLQLLMIQKQQFQLQSEEMASALEELAKATGRVYKSTGAILIESQKDDLTKELKEKKETLDVRLSVLSKQEEKLKARLTDLKNKIEAAAKGFKGGG